MCARVCVFVWGVKKTHNCTQYDASENRLGETVENVLLMWHLARLCVEPGWGMGVEVVSMLGAATITGSSKDSRSPRQPCLGIAFSQ